MFTDRSSLSFREKDFLIKLKFIAKYSYSFMWFLFDDRTIKLVDGSKRHVFAL